MDKSDSVELGVDYEQLPVAIEVDEEINGEDGLVSTNAPILASSLSQQAFEMTVEGITLMDTGYDMLPDAPSAQGNAPSVSPPYSQFSSRSSTATTTPRPMLPTLKFTPLQRQIWTEYIETGIVQLTDLQVVALSFKSNSVTGCMSYYFDNPALFAEDRMASTDSPSLRQALLQKHHLSSSSTSAKSNAPLLPVESMPAVMRVCCICQDELRIDEMYILDCSASHSLCLPCLTQYIRINTLGDANTQPHIPACPLANGPSGCRHLLSENEVCQVAEMAMDYYTESGEPLVKKLDGVAIQKAIRKLYLAKAHRDHHHMQCVNCAASDDESSWFALSSDGDAMRVACPKCGLDFCSQCQRSPCHFDCQCDEVVAYSRAWNEWLQGGRDVFLEELRRQSEAFNAAFADFQTKQKEVAAGNDRFRELQENEAFKAARCKRCPRCQRIIEKLDGCDAMICGQNYHGGDVQNGCGHTFNWSQAAAYVADVGQRRTPAEINTPAPAQAQQVHHQICEGVPLPCDNCSQPIVGPCIRCINCPSYNICLQCSTLDELQSDTHTRAHICTVIFE
eukprot:gene22995-29181_t